jgi:hypothetical protein
MITNKVTFYKCELYKEVRHRSSSQELFTYSKSLVSFSIHSQQTYCVTFYEPMHSVPTVLSAVVANIGPLPTIKASKTLEELSPLTVVNITTHTKQRGVVVTIEICCIREISSNLGRLS